MTKDERERLAHNAEPTAFPECGVYFCMRSNQANMSVDYRLIKRNRRRSERERERGRRIRVKHQIQADNPSTLWAFGLDDGDKLSTLLARIDYILDDTCE